MSYVLRLFAFQSARESVVSVKQPTFAWFRTSQGTSAITHAASVTPTVCQPFLRHSR